MSLKEIIFSMMNEALENMEEAVEVRHDRYMRSHGKKARDSGGGSSSWMFTHKDKGDVNVNDKEEVHTAQGKFADAKKSAQAWGKQHGHSSVYVMEEVDLSEAIQTMPDARLKFHALKDVPHGSYTKKQIDTEHDRRKKTMGAEYASVKPALSEEVELDEAETPTYHYYATKNGIGAKEMKLTHSKNKPFESETAALNHIIKTGGRKDGIIHKVNSATGKVVQHRGIDGGQKGYPTPASDMAGDAPKHVRDLKEEVQLDEISKATLGSYIKKASVDASEKRMKSDRMNTAAYSGKNNNDEFMALDRGANKAYKSSQNRLKGIAKATDKLTKEEVELDEISDEMKKKYIRAVADKGGILRKPRPASLAGIDKKKEDALAKAFKGGSMQQYADLHKKSEKRAEIGTKAINSLKKEEVELDEAKTDIYHKHMLKALGKTRLPKNHPYTSAVANNGDFVVRDSSSVVARIPKGEHNIKEDKDQE